MNEFLTQLLINSPTTPSETKTSRINPDELTITLPISLLSSPLKVEQEISLPKNTQKSQLLPQ